MNKLYIVISFVVLVLISIFLFIVSSPSSYMTDNGYDISSPNQISVLEESERALRELERVVDEF